MPEPTAQASRHIADFIHRWDAYGAAERANHALFLTQLCDLLDVPQPDPTTDDVEKNAYVFERGYWEPAWGPGLTQAATPAARRVIHHRSPLQIAAWGRRLTPAATPAP